MEKMFRNVMYTLFISCLFLSCTKDEFKPASTDSATGVSDMGGTENPCLTCESENLYKTVGNDDEVVGEVTICQTETYLRVTFTIADARTSAWLQRTGLGVFGEAPVALNPSPKYLGTETHQGKIKTYTYIIPLSSLGYAGEKIYIAAYAVVPGPDGAGGMVWAGDLTTPRGNPNSRYFKYTIKDCTTPEPPKEHY